MSKALLLVVILTVMCTRASPAPQFNPFAFIPSFPVPFQPFNAFNIPKVQIPDYANIFSFGADKVIASGGGVYQAQTFGVGGGNYESRVISSVTKDGKTEMTIYKNKNGDEKIEKVVI